MRILLTGARGALGSYIADILEPGIKDRNDVELFCVSRTDNKQNNRAFMGCDLLDASSQKQLLRDVKPDAIIHTAWETTHGSYWHAEENKDWSEASIQLAEQFADSGGGFFLFAGTCAECPWDGKPIRPVLLQGDPHTLYGIEKRRVTHHLMEFFEQKKLKTNASRIFFPYSERENSKRVTSFAINEILNQRPVHLRTGDVFRDICHTKRVAQAIANMTLAEECGLFNMCSDKPTHLGKFLSSMADIAGYPGTITWDDWSLSEKNNAEPRQITGESNLTSPLVPDFQSNQLADLTEFVEQMSAS